MIALAAIASFLQPYYQAASFAEAADGAINQDSELAHSVLPIAPKPAYI
jgi:hypothetical protein